MTDKATTPKTATTRTRTRKATQPAEQTTPETTQETNVSTETNTPEAPAVVEQTTETPQVEDTNENTDDELVWEEPPVAPKKQTKRQNTIDKLKTRPDTFARVASGLKYRNMASEWRKEDGLVVECTPDPETGLFNIYAKWNPEEAAAIAKEKADKAAARKAAKDKK